MIFGRYTQQQEKTFLPPCCWCMPESKCLMKCGNKIEKQSQRKLNEANFVLKFSSPSTRTAFLFLCVYSPHFRVGKKRKKKFNRGCLPRCQLKILKYHKIRMFCIKIELFFLLIFFYFLSSR